ncbi:polymeric immunoglobulin receptor-like isoform X2 [Mauremys reevesii]|uniref:polymeric immunoglobulin receptor-like isoform X2 n=1 Tax=Mauremys reevesii TaxID=260615 RepID=UPI00193F7D4A|nr:polymeric immunoglobulin receptor-like isoform X2 [Mauremys reevesii]
MGSAGGLCSSPRAWGCGWNVIRLLCFAFINWGAAENTAAVIVVNQTPPSICAMEGSEFTIECTFNTSNNSTRWFAEWNKIRNNVTAKVNGTDRIILSADPEKRSLSLTVKKADVTDSGTYVCGVGSKDVIYPGTGTQVTIDAVDLLVTQSPAFVNEEEGKQLTIDCRFRALEKPSTKYSVKWYKNGTDGHEKELKNKTGSLTTTLDFSAGLASLTLTNTSMSDSGFYRCDFGKNGRGNGTRVTIRDKRRNASRVLFIIRMVLGALVIILAVIIITECVMSEKRAAVSRTI